MQQHHTMVLHWIMRESASASSSEESLVSNFFGMRIVEHETNPVVVDCDTTSVLEEAANSSGDEEENADAKETEQPHFPNDRFRDVAETGAWGKVSSKEIIFVLIIALFLTAGVAVTSVYLLAKMKNNTGLVVLPPPIQTVEYDPMYHNRPDLYNALVGQIQQTSLASKILESFPEDFEGLTAALNVQGPNSDPYLKAAAWLVYSDLSPEKFASTIFVRFTLAATFFSMGGPAWNNSTNWMSPENVCEWYGVKCDKFKVRDIVLDKNNLSGRLHEAWESLETCQSMVLRGNQIGGTLPGEAFGALHKLQILELQNNLLSGTVPSSLANLDTLFVHGNPSLNGTWPFCTADPNQRDFREFGLNCDLIQCSCCNAFQNCFRD